MAEAPDERGSGPAAGEQSPEPHVSCQVFPEQGFFSSFTNDRKCQLMLLKTLETNPYVKLLLDAMKHSGWCIRGASKRELRLDAGKAPDRHSCLLTACAQINPPVSFCNCEQCCCECPRPSVLVHGASERFSKIVLCQNNIRNQAHMNRVVTHELIHAFDHCRAHVDWFTNVRHLACSEIRAANLSGDCSLINEIFRLHFGLKQHHQTCVRDRAILSILAVRNVSREVAQKAVDEVFESCFNDLEPFGRIPHSKTDAQYAHRDFQNRHRYYSNI
ncbi:mitochondrial inner membrane protease ATP23 homolog [Echinops telfairi]|uniref:Mitochondrial inner membrane protease ATP23 homolog n=1 Tax=Echinops telfairi TaxID=9371 RepID=A0AC55CZM4_ECHTE|nr:mitochondrial inner membrane protease ATP23 homolog [Echinops telfairi]